MNAQPERPWFVDANGNDTRSHAYNFAGNVHVVSVAVAQAEIDRLAALAAPKEAGAEVDLCEVARQLELVHIQHVISEVAAIAGDRTDAYWAGHANACEEIAHRLKRYPPVDQRQEGHRPGCNSPYPYTPSASCCPGASPPEAAAVTVEEIIATLPFVHEGWNAEATVLLRSLAPAGVPAVDGEACPICDGTGRVDSVRKCCGPPAHLDEPQPCNRPPTGWYCGLARGHEGPCPAWPVSHETARGFYTHPAGRDAKDEVIREALDELDAGVSGFNAECCNSNLPINAILRNLRTIRAALNQEPQK